MEGNTAISSSARSNPLEDSKYVDPNLLNRVEQKLKPAAVQEAKQDFTFNPPLKLVTVHEETEDESKSTDSSRTLSYESVGSGAIVEVKLFLDMTFLFPSLRCRRNAYKIILILVLLFLCFLFFFLLNIFLDTVEWLIYFPQTEQ